MYNLDVMNGRQFGLAEDLEEAYSMLDGWLKECQIESEDEFGETTTRFSYAYALTNKELGRELKKCVKRNIEHTSMVEDILEECGNTLYLEEDLPYIKMKAKQDELAIVKFKINLNSDVYSLADLKNPSCNKQLRYYMEESKTRGYKIKSKEDLMRVVSDISDSNIEAFLITTHEGELVDEIYEFVGDKLYVKNSRLLKVCKVKKTKKASSAGEDA